LYKINSFLLNIATILFDITIPVLTFFTPLCYHKYVRDFPLLSPFHRNIPVISSGFGIFHMDSAQKDTEIVFAAN